MIPSTVTIPAGLLPQHWEELQRSAIAPDVAALNVASFGPGTARHWEEERAELIQHKRLAIQTESVAGNGHLQGQAGHVAGALIALQQRYRHLQAGGWRTLSDTLPDVPGFDQWKCDQPRQKGKRDPQTGEWRPQVDRHGRPVPIKYEAPPGHPDGGGLLLPRVPDRCWRLICERQELPFPDAATRAAGFWVWAAATPELEVLVAEGWKKALAAISAGWAAAAVPGVTMGRRVSPDGTARLIPALQALAAPGRRWRIAFDAEAEESTAAKVGAAAGALARSLRAAGGKVEISRLPLLPGHGKVGLDDLLYGAGPEALDRALADVGPRPVLPRQRPADRLTPAGCYIAQAGPLPSPEEAPVLVLRHRMGAGKTEALSQHVAPLMAMGVAGLLASHRKAIGRAACERIGIPWAAAPGDDQRQLGVGSCIDSWCAGSGLRIRGDGWPGAVLVLDEWAQAVEHTLLASGTALGKRRVSVLLELAETIARCRQVIAAESGMGEPAVRLLERLTGRRALVIDSEHKPMAGRPLHCPEGLATPEEASAAFRVKWQELRDSGQSFLCWTSSQQHRYGNSPATLAELHRGALTVVIDSSTKELAAELAADPDGFAERKAAEAAALGVPLALYCSPSISSGISFARWKPDCVIAYSGGRVSPEHVAQALGRVRNPEVPGWVFAPERSPGGALKVGSGATDPARLIADLQAATAPLRHHRLLADLQAAGDPWLQAWAELGAHRNRQRHAYRATIAGLLQAEGWELQAPEPPRPDAQELADCISLALNEIASIAAEAEDHALLSAPSLTSNEARDLEGKRGLEPAEKNALARHKLLSRWGLLERTPALLRDGEITKAGNALLKADRDGLRNRLRLGWLLTNPAELALVLPRDRAAVQALVSEGQQPFAPDALRVTLAPRIAALWLLGTADRPQVLLELLRRFQAGETISANDPAVLALHDAALSCRGPLAAATGASPGQLATGTLRTLLRTVGWELKRAGRATTRGEKRPQLYRAAPVALPSWLSWETLVATWREELQAAALPPATVTLSAPTKKNRMGEKCHASPSSRSAWGAPPPPARTWAWTPPPRARSAPLTAA